MAAVREYHVTVNGHDTVMNLSEEDAKRMGGTPVEDTAEAELTETDPAEKAGTAQNKSRTAARNKTVE